MIRKNEIKSKYKDFKKDFKNKLEGNGKENNDICILASKVIREIYNHDFVKISIEYGKENNLDFLDQYGIYECNAEHISRIISSRKSDNRWIGWLVFPRGISKEDRYDLYDAIVPVFKLDINLQSYKILLYSWITIDYWLRYIDYISEL